MTTTEATWRELVAVGELAPSSHNSQPWRFALRPDGVDVLADRRRGLPAVDPDDRELTISCGAAAAFLDVAARGAGIATEVSVLPEPLDPDVLVRVRATGTRSPSADDFALLAATGRRRTVRRPFADLAVPPATVDALVGAAADDGALLVPLGTGGRAAFVDLLVEADRILAGDAAVRAELAAWLRPTGSGRDDGISGAVLGFGTAASHLVPFVARLPGTGGHQAEVDRRLALASPVVAVLATAGDRSADWLRAGLALGRLLLRATVVGVAASFLNAPVQVPALRPSVAVLAGVPHAHPQAVIRLGYGPTVPPSARRRVADVLDPAVPSHD